MSCDMLFSAHKFIMYMHVFSLQQNWNGWNAVYPSVIQMEYGIELEEENWKSRIGIEHHVWNRGGAVMYCGGERGTVVMGTLPHPSTIRDRAFFL